jgi:hypothetical protein
MTEESKIECAVCGIPGPPSPGCKMCHGRANTQSRAFTLSEVTSGRVPEDQKEDRYGETGNVGPKIVTNLPGSSGPGGGIGS